jgi:hypothetical protein
MSRALLSCSKVSKPPAQLEAFAAEVALNLKSLSVDLKDTAPQGFPIIVSAAFHQQLIQGSQLNFAHE